MKLYEITNHQWAIIETMNDAWQIDVTREENDYALAQQPSTTYTKLLKREIEEYGNGTITELFENGGIVDAMDDEIIVYEGTVDGEWCRIYIPTYWD